MIPENFIKYRPKRFSRGRRSTIYLFKKGNRKYIIKTKKKGISAKDPMKNEAKFLKILNKHNMGPKYITSGKNYVVYEFVKGKFFVDYLKTSRNPKKIIKDVLKQCRILDKLKINKKEMHHPIKHILIYKKPVMIDFERCYYAEKPKNVTQFCQFLRLNNLIEPRMIPILKEYKKNENNENFKKILKLV